MILNAKPEFNADLVPKNCIRRFLFYVVNIEYFEYLIFLCIFLNIVTMACLYDQSPIWLVTLRYYVNNAFTIIFIGEAVMKIIALGPRNYWRDVWNRFDFFVCISSILDFAMSS